jgi:VanZ family protein
MSGAPGSPGLSGEILAVLIPPSSPMFEPAHFLLRKTAHVIAYGLLGALDFRAVRGSRIGWALRWSIIAVALATTIAVLDEWHQSTVPLRTGSPWDVAIDFSGAVLAQIAWRVATGSPEISARRS